MGMAASQVRFLSLQHRKHDIGRQLTSLSNKKMALSRDMNKVSRNYTNALNQKMLKWSNNSGASYVDLSYGLMMKPNETNTSVPYIVSDRNGRVIVDNKAGLLEGLREKYTNEDGILKGLQFSQAFMEKYGVKAGLCDEEGNTLFDGANAITYENIARILTSQGGGKITTDNNGVISGTAAKDDIYKIPTSASDLADFDFDDNLRYQIFQEMGLISDETNAQYTRILKELYGSSDAKANGYQIETNSSIGTNSYDDIFGAIRLNTNGNFDFNTIIDNQEITTGSAMGNLELAKKYKEEFQYYMNTPIKMPFDGSGTVDLTNQYAYSNIANTKIGTTARILDILMNKFQDRVTETSTDVGYRDNVSNAGIYNSSIILDEFGSVSPASFKIDGPDTGLQKLNDVYNLDTAFDEQVDVKWSDILTSSDYFVVFEKVNCKYNGHATSTINRLDNVLSNIITACKTAVTSSGSWNEDAGEYARYMTLAKFSNNVDLIKNSKDSSKNGTYETIKANIDAAIAADKKLSGSSRVSDGSVKSEHYGYRGRGDKTWAIDNAYDINGVGQFRNTGPDDEYAAVSLSNLAKTYITFYNAYVETNGVPAVSWKFGSDIVARNSLGVTLQSHNTTLENLISNAETTSTDTYYSYYMEEYSEGEQSSFGKYEYHDTVDTITSADGTVTEVHNDMTTGFTSNAFDILKDKNKTWADLTPEEKSYLAENNVHNITSEAEFNEYHNKMSQDNIVKYTESRVNKTTYNNISVPDGSGESFNVTKYENIVEGKIKSVIFEFENHPTYTSYVLNYDDYGNFVSSTTYAKNSDNNWLATSSAWVYGGEDHHNAGSGLKNSSTHGILTCQIDTGSGDTYTIGKFGGYGENISNIYTNNNSIISSYANYLVVNPKDSAGIGAKLDQLVNDCQARVDSLLEQLENLFAGAEGKVMDYFDAIFERISEQGWVSDNKTQNNTYLNNKLQNNDYFVTVCQTKGEKAGYNYTNKMASMITKIFEVNDDNAQNIALSQYEAEKSLISAKERKIDNMMVKLETEQEVINTELESIQKVENENIQRTFKIFA